MRNFQDTFEARKQSFIGAFSICMTVPLIDKKKCCGIITLIYELPADLLENLRL